jgi:hypothetical protein
MAQLISDIWLGLRNAGIPEVMLYLPDHSASRCHWDDTTVIGGIRIALLADQERKIVRLLPVDSCTGIGVASPKGVDPSGYKATVQNKLNGNPEAQTPAEEAPVAAVAAAPPPPPPPVAVAPVASAAAESPARPENPASRWGGLSSRSSSPGTRFGATSSGSASRS